MNTCTIKEDTPAAPLAVESPELCRVAWGGQSDTYFEDFPHDRRLTGRMEQLSITVGSFLKPSMPDAETMVHNYYPYIYRLVASIVGDAAAADDIVQETFITAFERLEQFAPDTNLRAWLSTIAVNKSRDYLRREGRRERLKQALQLLPFRRALTPEQMVVRVERQTELWTAVEGLAEKHRLPLILRYVHGLAVKEIAEILEIKEGTVHSRLHYACKKVAGQIQVQRVVER